MRQAISERAMQGPSYGKDKPYTIRYRGIPCTARVTMQQVICNHPMETSASVKI